MMKVKMIILVLLSASLIDATAQENNRSGIINIWVMEKMNGNPIKVPKGLSQPYLEFQSEDSRMMGSTSCNDLNAQYTLRGSDSISFTPIKTTRKACEDMAYEAEFMGNLRRVRRWRVAYNRLELYDADNNELLRFKKVD